MNENEIRQKAQNDSVSPGLVFKEYVQFLILEFLFKKGLFSEIVFQGGTAIRLAYQGVRYSEDLDFVLKKKNLPCFKNLSEELNGLASHVKKFIPTLADTRLKIQKETLSFKRYCLSLTADFLNATDKTNIEIANIPSYDNRTAILQSPGFALSPAVTVETPREILSDKIIAFSARAYLKGRDIWDIFYLSDSLKIPVDADVIALTKKKIRDYGVDEKKFRADFAARLTTLKETGSVLLREEMNKFLPAAYRNIFESRYPEICLNNKRILSRFLEEFSK